MIQNLDILLISLAIYGGIILLGIVIGHIVDKIFIDDKK